MSNPSGSRRPPPKKCFKTGPSSTLPVLESYKTRLFTKLTLRRSRSAEKYRKVLLQIDPSKPLNCSGDVQKAILELPTGQELLENPNFIALLLEVDAEKHVGTAASNQGRRQRNN